jgi:Cu(I)/Ag(I) efflux system protein CusF
MKNYAIAVAAALAFSGAPAFAQHDHGAMNMSAPAAATHKAHGVVKAVDARAGTISLAHEPVKTLNWPAMTMTFKVQDPTLLAKCTLNKTVDIEFQQQGKDYVVVSLK